MEHGPRELESMLQAIVFTPAAAVLIVDSEGCCKGASAGLSRLLRAPRSDIVGR